MSRGRICLLVLACVMLVPVAPAARLQRPSAADGAIEVLPVHGQVSLLAGPAGNTAVQVGPQGIIVVDTMRAEDADALLAAVRKVGGDRPIRYIINTHAHSDRVVGNVT